MKEDEKYVREHWELYGYEPRRGHDGKFGIITVPMPSFGDQDRFESLEEAWSAAAEFTRTRLNEIRQVEEEISLLNGWKWVVTGNAAANRILAREQAALADLKRGLRVAE